MRTRIVKKEKINIPEYVVQQSALAEQAKQEFTRRVKLLMAVRGCTYERARREVREMYREEHRDRVWSCIGQEVRRLEVSHA